MPDYRTCAVAQIVTVWYSRYMRVFTLIEGTPETSLTLPGSGVSPFLGLRDSFLLLIVLYRPTVMHPSESPDRAKREGMITRDVVFLLESVRRSSLAASGRPTAPLIAGQ